MEKENKEKEMKEENKEKIVGTGEKELEKKVEVTENNEGPKKVEEKKVGKKEEPKKVEEKKVEVTEKKEEPKNIEEVKTEKKVEAEKKEEPKKKKKKDVKLVPKKEDAVARGVNLRMSKKHAVYICSFIKDKKIDDAILDLEEVKKMKLVVPFKGEVPHRKGKGMMSGRYPVKAAGLFINVLKALKGNSLVNGLDLDKTRIYFASGSWASRPLRSGSRQGKRTNLILKSKEILGGKMR